MITKVAEQTCVWVFAWKEDIKFWRSTNFYAGALKS